MTKNKKVTQRSTQGKDEMNLVDFPFATVHPNDSRKAIIYNEWVIAHRLRFFAVCQVPISRFCPEYGPINA